MSDDAERRAQQQHVALADEAQVYIGIGHLNRNQANAGDDEAQRATAARRDRAKLVSAVPRRHVESHCIHASRTPAWMQWDSTCRRDRKSTRLNSSHTVISYAVFCLKKKKIYHIVIFFFN